MSGIATLVPAFPFLKRASRGMGRRICGAPGSGKTRLAARLLLPFDLMADYPIITIDPTGALTKDFLDVIDRMHPHTRAKYKDRIRYVNMAGQRVGEDDYVFPFPYLYRKPDESFYDVAHRFLDVVKRSDPALQSASIFGWNAVEEIAENVLIALIAMGCQITEAEPLLKNTPAWIPRLRQAQQDEPEAAPAIGFLLETYAPATPKEKKDMSFSFLRKLSPYRLNRMMRAMYGASVPAFTPEEVVEDKLCVIFDFQRVSKKQRQLGILWLYHYFNTYFRERGAAGRDEPVAFYLDELSYLLPEGKKRDELIADDLAELFSRTARNNGIFATVIHQDLAQFDEATNTLLSRLGTQIIGVQADVKAVQSITERFYRYDKHKAKDYRAQYATFGGVVEEIDRVPVYESPQEQTIENAYRFLDLEAFVFLVGVAEREGRLPTQLSITSFADFDKGIYARQHVADRLRAHLMAKHGQKVDELLAQIAARSPEGNRPQGARGEDGSSLTDDEPIFQTRVRTPR